MRAPRLDRGEQVARRDLAEPLPFAQAAAAPWPSRAASVKMSAAILISPSSKNSSICLSPSPSMSKALREQKCFSPSTACAGADEAAGAAAHDVALAGLLVDLAQRRRAADRADEVPFRPAGRRRRSRRPAACRATTSRTCGMTSPARCTTTVSPTRTSSARDLVLVVQRGVGDDDAADGHRMQLGDRRQRAGAADLDLDRFDDRRRPFGRELVRDRPARAARDEAEPLLQREVVDLVDDAVDVVAERRRAAPRSRGNGASISAGRSAELGQRIDRQAEALERVDRAVLRRRRSAR